MRIFIAFLLGTALLSNWPESGEAAELPAYPQVFIATTYSPPSGNTIVVNAGGNLQTAINNAVPGDTIVLQAGATFAGPFTLPNKVGSSWIYIVSSALSSLPAAGTRVSIADAVNMPKIVRSAAGLNAILTNAQAHNYRFVGIEIRPATGLFVTNLVAIGGGETSLADLPHDITFDRCYIHGDPIVGGRRGVAMNGASVAVVDSYVSDFKENGSDTQALWSYNSPGPVKIVNNFLEASGENVMFGGSDPAIANLVPSDIEIRRNHFFKPLSWITENSPNLWTVKNLLEFKNAQRILVEGNIFENIWVAAQIGTLMNAKSVNQGGRCTWCVTRDLTFRYNRGINLENGFSLAGDASEGGFHALRTDRVLIEHNVVAITMPGNGGAGRIFQFGGGPTNVTIRHNTGLITVAGGFTAVADQAGNKGDQFDFRDNILSKGSFGFKGSGTGEGTGTLDGHFTNYTFTNNAIIGSTGTYPAGNFFPSNNAAVGFVNFAGGDYTLGAGSPFKGLGANFAGFAAAATASSALPPPVNFRVQ